jgi:serine kinase of HPr protein (carbohydrate metabolism regulator)
MLLLYGTCVALQGKGILLLGGSGYGKSDLALRLIHDKVGELVADDQVWVEKQGQHLVASAPQMLRGMLEVRGVGIVEMPYVSHVPLTMVFSLTRPEMVERLPESSRFHCLDVSLPLVTLNAFEPSAIAKIVLASHAHEHNLLRS